MIFQTVNSHGVREGWKILQKIILQFQIGELKLIWQNFWVKNWPQKTGLKMCNFWRNFWAKNRPKKRSKNDVIVV